MSSVVQITLANMYNKVVKLNIQISQHNAVTNLKQGGRIYSSFLRVSSQNAKEKVLKSV